MNLKEFLQTLTESPNKELVFQLEDVEIRKDYHITEVLTTTVEAIDCGGKVDGWKETVLQLIEPSRDDGERFMSNSKALSILEKSFKIIKSHDESNLVLEFKPQGSLAAQRYNVADILTESNKLIVVSQGAKTQCKAAIRSNPDGIDTCCDPKPKKESSSASSCCGTGQKTSCCG